MGFILFDKSGTFDPTTYGLSPGDVVHAVVVGGGGGGCYNSNTSTYGGNGGASSFGNYVTALGGYGAVYNQTNPWRSTPTQYMTKGAATGYNNVSNYTILGGSGGGGWYPGYKRGAGYSWGHPQLNISGSQYEYVVFDVKGETTKNTGGTPGRYFSNSSSSYFAFRPVTTQDEYWSSYLLSSSANSVTMQFAPVLPVAGGCGMVNGNSYYDGTPYCRNNNCRGYNQGNGGLGYGAGGGSASPTTYTAGGCGGELREGDFVLTSVSPVAITVGGGGAGGAYYTNNSTVTAGNDGSAGAAGTAYNSYTCPGGYGTVIPTPAGIFTNTNYSYNCGGGGAGGCVALWW